MRKSLFILFAIVCSTTLFSQTKTEEEAKQFFWGAEDKYKTANTIPDKWKNESAVIIYKNENYDFHKYGKRVTYKTAIRKRIKLLDNAAVKEFSEFSFVKRFNTNKGRYTWKKKGDNVVGVKIIKPSGDEVIIDVNKDAVEEEGETKVAIPNLEVGDIIDYFFYKVEPFKSTTPFTFKAVETTLAEEYPIVDFKLYFETENDFFVNFKSFNGAPELEQIPTDKNNFRRYKLESSNIEKKDRVRWTFPLLELPCYKFQVYFARRASYEDDLLGFLSDKERDIKTEVSRDEVLDLYQQRFSSKAKINDIKDFLKDKTFSSEEEKVKAAYYYMRHHYLTRFIEAYIVKQAEIVYYPYSYYETKAISIQNKKRFIRYFAAFLKRQKIGYDIVIAKKKYDGSIDDLLIEDNVNLVLKVKTNTPIYLDLFGPHTSINEFSPLLEGTKVYLLETEKGKIESISEETLPLSTCEDNMSNKSITLELDDSFSEINIKSLNEYKGHLKTDVQYDKMIYSDYVHEDYKKYETTQFIDLVKKKKTKAKYSKEIDALIKKYKERIKESLVKSAKQELSVSKIENYDYNIKSTGRYDFDSYFSYQESYTIKDQFIKKAGPNYILEIGKFIGGQIELKEDQKNRDENINMAYARTFNYDINLKIPEGYTVNGLDKLNKSVENATGTFVSSATIEGENLVVKTKKEYKSAFVPSKNWELMVDFLNEAHQFTNEKILLKKK